MAPEPQGSEPRLSSGTPAERAGSLTVPTTAEAIAEKERTPGAVTVIPDTAYKNAPATTLKDVLDYVPGVFIQPRWGEDSRLSIRGSGLARNYHLRGVALLMDGIPVNTADGHADFQEIDPTAFRYVEVYRGADALQYGANSLGGAVNFVTPTGRDQQGSTARFDVGSFGYARIQASTGAKSGAVDGFISGSWTKADGFRDQSEGESFRGSANLGFRLSENVETRFFINANKIDQEIPGAVTKAGALNDPETAWPENVRQDQARNVDSIRISNKTAVRLAPGTLVEFGGFYVDRKLDHPIFVYFDYDYEEYGAFARLTDTRDIGGFKNKLVAGTLLHDGTTDAHRFENLTGGVKGAELSRWTWDSENRSIYIENSFYVLKDLAIVGGTQFQHSVRDQQVVVGGGDSRKDTFNLWSPKAGLLWEMTPSSQAYANVSRSAEVPIYDDLYHPFFNTYLGTKAQRATTYEIGTRGRTPDFSWDLAIYRSELKDELMCYAAQGSVCFAANAPNTVHQGVEIGFGASLVKGVFVTAGNMDELVVNAAYTFSDFKFENDATFGDNELPGVPRHYVRAEVLYKHPSGVYLGPNVEWVPEGYFADAVNVLSTDAYAIWGARLGFDDGGPISVYVEGRNLSDTAYIASSAIVADSRVGNLFGGTNEQLFEPGTGRAIYGGVQFKW